MVYVSWEEVFPEHKLVAVTLPSLIGAKMNAASLGDWDVTGIVVHERQRGDMPEYDIKVESARYGPHKKGDVVTARADFIGWVKLLDQKFSFPYQFAAYVAGEENATEHATQFMSRNKRIFSRRGWFGDRPGHSLAARGRRVPWRGGR